MIDKTVFLSGCSNLYSYSKEYHQDFPGGSVVNNLPANAGDMGLAPGRGTKIPQAVEQLSQCAITRESPQAAMKTYHSQK